MNTNLTINNDLNLLAKALRADTFHFILIGHNHPDVYRDVAAWLRTNLPDRRIEELHVTGKRYREVSDALRNAGQDIVLIPDFDSIFLPDNDALRIALNQRRDFLAHQKMNLLCFISPDTFKLLPTKIPDLWSLRSLELDIAYDVKAELFTQKSGAGFTSSLGGTSIAEKEAEIRRLRYQIRQTDPNNSALLNELESQIVTLQSEVPQRFEPEPNVPDTTIANNNESNTTAADKEPTETISETALLSIFAVLPAEPINRTVLHELLSGINNLDATLQSLIKEGLIAFDEKDDSFRCDSEVQETTRQQNGEQLFEHCELLISTLIDKLHYEPGTGHFLNATYEEALIYAKYAESILQHSKKAEENLATLAERLGNFHTTTGNLDKALTFYEDYSRLFEELYDAFPSNVSFKNNLAISYSKLGETHAQLGNLDKALTFYEQYRQLTKELYDAFPSNVSFKNGLAISYEKLGETHAQLGNLDKALTFYDDETRLFEELYDAFPSNVSFKNNLAISYSKLGETHAQLGNLDKALTFYEQYRQLTKELYDAFPSNVSFKNGLAISYEKLGETHAQLGNLDKALTFYEQYRQLTKELYDAFPSNVSFKNGLAISYEKLGETHAQLGNLDKALTFYEQYRQLTKELYDAFPSNVSFKNGLAISYYKLGVFYKANRSDNVTTRNYLQQAEALWTELTESAPGYFKFQRNLSNVRNILSELPQS
ncbi:MAG: tetratricopeptide repeat protein [Chlorobium sp.]